MTIETPRLVSDEILLAITPTGRRTKAGWIFPDGSIVPCPVMGHRGVLPVQYRERYEELLEERQRYMYACLDELEEGEHPEMHRFDPEWEAASELEIDLAEEGFARFGICQNEGKMGMQTHLDIRCTKKMLASRNVLIAHIIAVLGIDIVEWSDPTSHSSDRHYLRSFGASRNESDRLAEIKALRS